MSRTRNTADLVSLNALNANGGKVGIGTTARSNQLYVEGNAQVTGVVTASSFVGDGSGLTGLSTFSGSYNDLTNKPTIPTNNNQLTNGAGYITNSVTGDLSVSGNVSIGGTLTYEDVTNVDSVGLVTARTGIDVLAGGINVTGVSTFNDQLHLPDNTKIMLGDSNDMQILHIPGNSNSIQGTQPLKLQSTSEIHLREYSGSQIFGKFKKNGPVELYYSGNKKFETTGTGVTVYGTTETQQLNVTGVVTASSFVGDGSQLTNLPTSSGINSAPNVLYVAKDGNDADNGTSIDNAKLTIKSAIGIAQSGTVIKVLSGNYVENNPITVPAFVSVVGDDLRSVKVLPSNTTQDIFHVNKGCKLANMTFSGHISPSAAVAFPTGIATNVGGGKWKGPYIQNCTSDTTTGTGIRIDGNLAVKTKSMNVDAFTQYNQGGVGVAVTNEGYAQLVSVFTICCDKAITAHNGGQADLANSNCSFGTFGLVADGVSPEQFTGIVTSSGAASQDNIVVNVGAVTTRPYDGQVVYFDKLYRSVENITITSGGSGYTSTPSVSISSPTGPNGEVATAFATIENGSVTDVSIISGGSQYAPTDNITVTISAPDSGSTATATANMVDTYYTINSATPIVSGITTLTLDENLINTVGVGSTAYFFQQSKIVASSHTFEYIGSGNDITTATPKRGGVTVQENEVVSQNGGRVIYTSTDQAGNFRIGDDLQINQLTGTISGRAFSRSLFSEVTPFILALS